MKQHEGFNLEHDGTMGMISVKAQGRGSVPVVLRGDYTSYTQAKKAIDQYLTEKKPNGKAKSN